MRGVYKLRTPDFADAQAQKLYRSHTHVFVTIVLQILSLLIVLMLHNLQVSFHPWKRSNTPFLVTSSDAMASRYLSTTSVDV